ncbi:hypothetical protein BYT27DRAFT_6709699 [Phlegmacium glaucopus]|nr:hypothetical protein BYT27DRAFT_6709699 [Phlegmacium glaucopus]
MLLDSTCPYVVGMTLNLTTIVDIHGPESRGDSLSVHVDHVFLPFTKSQAMRIRVFRPSPDSTSDMPEVAVLKLYDRRWIDDRKFDDQPWSPAREEAAQMRWTATASGDLVDDFDTLSSDDYTPSHEEEQHRRTCKLRFETEREAYRRLSDLQGVTIPRLYKAVIVSSLDITPRNAAETLIYGIIIEKIDAMPLPSVDPSSYNFSSLGHSLMAAAYSFSSRGVIHNDVRSDNILISPKRIVLIDFGQAILRGDSEDAEQWAGQVDMEDEVEGLRRILHNRRIRDSSPYIPMKDDGYGFSLFNHNMSLQRESWRNRWYDQVSTLPKNSDDDGKSEQPPWWTLKKEVQEWLDSRPYPPESFKVPRLGSPSC